MDTNAGDQSVPRAVPAWDEDQRAGLFLAIQREVREIPVDEAKVVVQNVLDMEISGESMNQVLEYLFDDFVRLLGTDCFLQLQEKCKDVRSLCTLIRKIQVLCEGDSGEASLASLQCTGQQWSGFVAIISALEEQEEHLAASTLGNHLPQLQLMSNNLGERWLAWLRILCLRLLQEERILVLRKVLDYLLTHLSVAQLCRFSLLPEFLMATNRSQLFDPEDDNCLKEEQLEQFVADGSVELLLEALVNVSWESVPLLLWIRSLQPEQVESISKELFFKLCLVVRGLGNYDLREGAQFTIVLLFNDTLNSFSLRDYMSCMDSLFNKGDSCIEHLRLTNKINNCTDFEAHIDCFNRRSFEIFLHNVGFLSIHSFQKHLLETFIRKLQTVPKDRHGFWRLVLYNEKCEVLTKFYRNTYNVDMTFLQKGAILEEMRVHLFFKLSCKTDEEISFLNARSVDLFTSNLQSWSQLKELNLDPLELIDQGSQYTISTLARLLGEHRKRVDDGRVLRALIVRMRSHYDGKNILRYAFNNLTEKEFESCLTDLMRQKKLFLLPEGELSVSLYVKLLLGGEPTKGVSRIEGACAFYLLNIAEYNAQIREEVMMIICMTDKKKIGSQIFKELLRINEELSVNQPYYTENSYVHRQKMRIASALIDLRHHWDGKISLETLLSPSDHLDINLLHEFLVGSCVKNIDWALKALLKLKPRQQESYLSIVYIYILRNWFKIKKEKLAKMFTSIVPLIMKPSYGPHTLAKLILFKLAAKCKKDRINIPLAVSLKNAIEASWGGKLDELQGEPRLLLANNYFNNRYVHYVSDAILTMINAPFDEFVKPEIYWNSVQEKIRNARQGFKARKFLLSAEFPPPDNLNEEISRTPIFLYEEINQDGHINWNLESRVGPFNDVITRILDFSNKFNILNPFRGKLFLKDDYDIWETRKHRRLSKLKTDYLMGEFLDRHTSGNIIPHLVFMFGCLSISFICIIISNMTN